MTRAERAVLLLLCIFAVKFVCSTVTHFVPALQGIDMLGSGRHPVDVWLLLLSWHGGAGHLVPLPPRGQSIGGLLTKFDAVVLAICIAASAAFYLHAMVGGKACTCGTMPPTITCRSGWNPTLQTAYLPA